MNYRLKINKNWVRLNTEKYPILHNLFYWSDGLNFEETEKEEQRPDKHILGDANIQPVVLQENMDWSEFWPEDERQSGSIETMSCTLFNLFNPIEALAKRQFGEVWNKSEHFNAGMIKMTRNGYTLSGAIDSVRKKHGMVDESIYPNDIDNMTWAKWIRTPEYETVQRGLYWLSKYDVFYKEIPNTRAGILNGLTFSPVFFGGYAWFLKNGLYYSFSTPNHACAIKKGIKDTGQLFAGDSYAPFEKELAPDYKIYWPKIIILRKKEIEYNQNEIDALRKRGLKFIIRALGSGEIYELTDTGLKYLTAEQARDIGLRTLEEAGKFIGISEELYNKLIV